MTKIRVGSPSRENAGPRRAVRLPAQRTVGIDRFVTDIGPTMVNVEGATASSGVTALDLSLGGEVLASGVPGVPVARAMTADEVVVSWMSSNVPAGDWTMRLWRRPSGGASFSEVATFSVHTS